MNIQPDEQFPVGCRREDARRDRPATRHAEAVQRPKAIFALTVKVRPRRPEDHVRNADDYCVKYQSAKAVALVFVGTIALASMANAQSALSIPKPDLEFKGKIGETLKDSVPSYPPPIKAPQDAPNVLIILLDDVGFGQTSTLGGPVPTPTLDRLAKNGLMY